MNFEEFVSRLKGQQGHMFLCPAHDDRNPSLSVKEDDGKLLVKCFAGCSFEEVCEAVRGLSPDHSRTAAVSQSMLKPKKEPKVYASAPDAILDFCNSKGPYTKVWVYKNAAGTIIGAIVRWEKAGGGKEFFPFSMIGPNQWQNCHMATPRVPYRLPELLDSTGTVVIVEGEKAADAAVDLGQCAITSVAGSNQAKGTDWAHIKGREVVIVPDNDTPGDKYAKEVARLCYKADAASVSIAKLPQVWAECGEGGDTADLLAKFGKETATKMLADLLSKAVPVTEAEALKTNIPTDCDLIEPTEQSLDLPVSQETAAKKVEALSIPIFERRASKICPNYMRVNDSWICPELLKIRNYFFAWYESNNGALPPKDRRLCATSFGAGACIKAIIGKRAVASHATTYCGSDAIVIVNSTTAGKSKIWCWLTEHIYLLRPDAMRWKSSCSTTMQGLLKEVRKVYCPDAKPPGDPRAKPQRPPDQDVMRACKYSHEGFFLANDELSEPLAQMSGAWSGGKQTSETIMMKMFDDPAAIDPLDFGSSTNGKEGIYDWAFVMFGATTLTKLRKSFNIFDKGMAESGLAGRIACIVDDENTYDYDSANLTPPTEAEFQALLKQIEGLSSMQQRRYRFSPESRKIDSLDFGDQQYIVDAFKKNQPTEYNVSTEKTVRQAMTDAMLWAILIGREEIDTGWGKSVDCSDLLPLCLKARVAMLINAYRFVGGVVEADYRIDIYNKVASNPGIHSECLKTSIEKSKARHGEIIADLEFLVADGIIIAVKDDNKSGPGRRPTMHYTKEQFENLNKEGK